MPLPGAKPAYASGAGGGLFNADNQMRIFITSVGWYYYGVIPFRGASAGDPIVSQQFLAALLSSPSRAVDMPATGRHFVASANGIAKILYLAAISAAQYYYLVTCYIRDVFFCFHFLPLLSMIKCVSQQQQLQYNTIQQQKPE